MLRHKYKLIPLRLAIHIELISQGLPVSLENDEEAIALKTLLDDGYRWTQTTPEYAVFEKAEGGVRQTAREVIGLINDLHFGDGCRYSNARNVTCKACLAQDALAPLAGITPPLDEEEEGHERH